MTPAEALALARALPTRRRHRSHVDEILALYDVVDARLVAAGFPPTSPWWRATIERWYRSGKRQAVLRAGRRAGKSSTLSRLLVVEGLYGHHDIPPGDTGVGAIISTRREEAGERIATVKAILDALGVRHRPWGEHGVRLVDKRIGFRVYTASIAGVSGFTAIFVLCDEVAKWKDSDTGVNPAGEVLKSVRPTMATQREARIVLSSSPMGMLDAHYDAFEEGETDFQVTAYAPTWEANPTLTEEDTRALEPDEFAWVREYKAVPQAEAESSLYTEALIRRATRVAPDDLPPVEGHWYVASMDPAEKRNAWTLVVTTKGADSVRRVVLAREWRPRPGLQLSPKGILAEIAALVQPYGVRIVHTDQHAVVALQEHAQTVGLYLQEEPWNTDRIREAYQHVGKLLQDNLLELPPNKQLQADLLGVRRVLTRSGVRYELVEARGRHSDFAPALAMGVVDARFAARPPEEEKSAEQQARDAKVAFLENRRREQERAKRVGRPPVTHRRVAAGR